jgi:hypothetical protein
MALPIIGSILSIGEKLIEKLIPDPKLKAEALQKLAEMEQKGDLAVIAGQVEINKIEAANTNLFIAGWRPFLGWVCAGAFAISLVVIPLTGYVALVAGRPLPPPPKMETEQVMMLLTGMLGLGGMRTIEKLSGAEKNR